MAIRILTNWSHDFYDLPLHLAVFIAEERTEILRMEDSSQRVFELNGPTLSELQKRYLPELEDVTPDPTLIDNATPYERDSEAHVVDEIIRTPDSELFEVRSLHAATGNRGGPMRLNKTELKTLLTAKR